MAQTNSINAQATSITQDFEDRIMQALPAELRNWLRYEATLNYSTVEIFRAWRAGHRIPNILAWLRGEQRKNTLATYGREHPQASCL